MNFNLLSYKAYFNSSIDHIDETIDSAQSQKFVDNGVEFAPINLEYFEIQKNFFFNLRNYFSPICRE